jgi:uncharacterized protein
MKIETIVRVYEELNAFLPSHQQKKDFTIQIDSNTQIQELLDILKLPISKVDLILLNGESAGLDYQLNAGDRISIYPVFETFNIDSINRLREIPLRRLRFACDVHLGKLAKYLRMLGLDVFYKNDIYYYQIINLSLEQERIILTKDNELVKDKRITRAYLVKQSNPRMQLFEIISYFDLIGIIKPLSRCLKCNLSVQPVEKNSIKKQVPAPILNLHQSFMKCYGCKRIYWMGSHYQAMMNWISRI